MNRSKPFLMAALVLSLFVGEKARSNGAEGHACPDMQLGVCRATEGDEVTVQAGEKGIRFLLVSGKPIEEPVAWYGPIVMNTPEELREAWAELKDGTFIKG